MSNPDDLVAKVRQADVQQIELPVLRHLVDEIQSKPVNMVSREHQHWTDNNWSQWRQHSSHNPW